MWAGSDYPRLPKGRGPATARATPPQPPSVFTFWRSPGLHAPNVFAVALGSGSAQSRPRPLGGLSGAPGATPRPGYAQRIAQSHTSKHSATGGLDASVCPRWVRVGECAAGGHHYAKLLICNREWCSYCGGDGGLAHARRISQKLPRALQIDSMGKFTITIPPRLRGVFRDKTRLAGLGRSIKRMLQRYGYDRGIRRWHLFGEDHSLGNDHGAPTYHPHLEAIVEGRFLSSVKLYGIKRSVAAILGVGVSEVNVHYSYRTNPRGKMHFLRYMLRPTFEDLNWDPTLAMSLAGLKNCVSWGRWRERVWNSVSGKFISGDYLPPVWECVSKGGGCRGPAVRTGDVSYRWDNDCVEWVYAASA